MSAHKPIRSGWAERVARSMLALALLSAVVWALTDGSSAATDFSLQSLWR